MTLNLWGYHDWDNRTDNLLFLIDKEAPDCIALQEVLTNHAFSDYPSSDFIADTCGYAYRAFAPTYPRSNSKDRAGNRNQRASYGQAFLSKHPIVTVESYYLKLYPEHPEENSVQLCKIAAAGRTIDIWNVHFANHNLYAGRHLQELMGLAEKRQIHPIVVGDFNIWAQDMPAYKQTALRGYTYSTDVASYISLPADGNTLDYIVIPTSLYTMHSVHSPDTYVSDHRAVLATIGER